MTHILLFLVTSSTVNPVLKKLNNSMKLSLSVTHIKSVKFVSLFVVELQELCWLILKYELE